MADDPIVLSDYLNLDQIESALREKFDESTKAEAVVFDLRSVCWVSPFTISIFWSWLYHLRSKGVAVHLVGPKKHDHASTFLHRTGFFTHCESLGVTVDTRVSLNVSSLGSKLMAFERFESRDTASRYIARLSDMRQRSSLLHSEEMPEIVMTGDFARTILNELLENIFTHANGLNCHFAAFEAEETGRSFRKHHSVFAGFGGAGYIEITMGDSGDRNIIDTVKDHVRADYDPSKSWTLATGHPTERELAILYAFEYGSTSNPQARKDKIENWFKILSEKQGSAGMDAAFLGTGLFNNLALINLYGGQIIVRTDGVIANLDCSHILKAGDKPRCTFYRPSQRQPRVNLPGTIITLRVPVRTEAGTKRIVPKRVYEPSIENVRTIGAAVPPGYNLSTGAHSLLSYLEGRILTASGQRHDATDVLLGVSLAGLSDPPIAQCGLLCYLAQVPRRGVGLLVAVTSAELLDYIGRHWDSISSGPSAGASSMLRYPSLLIADSAGRAISAYGNSAHTEATSANNGNAILPSGKQVSLEQALNLIRTDVLKEVISGAGVCHKGSVYLVGRYYTNKYYEIGQLARNQHDDLSVSLWLRDHVALSSPTAIIHKAPTLDKWLRQAYRLAGNKKLPELIHADDESISANVVQAYSSSPGERRIFIVCDVICTSSYLRRFFDAYPFPNEVTIVAIVDARSNGREYYPVPTSKGTKDVPVISVLRDPIQDLNHRPGGVEPQDVVVIDKRSKRPVAQDLMPDLGIEANEELLVEAAKAGALGVGHYGYKDTHYLYVLSFARAFQAWGQRIDEWLVDHELKIITASGILPEEVVVYCIDDRTGILNRALACLNAVGVKTIIPLERSELDAAPIKKDAAAAVWCIIPAMAEGRTLQACVEYINQVAGPKLLRVSALFARMDARSLRFYQGVHSFLSIDDLHLGIMVQVSLPGYQSASCPLCSLKHKLESILSDAVSFPALEAALRDAAAPTALESLERNRRVSNDDAESQERLGREAYMMSLYLRSDRDLRARNRLKHLTETPAYAMLFVTAVGRAPMSPSFSAQEIAERHYRKEHFEEACRIWCASPPTNDLAFRLSLRGFCALCPDLVRQVLPTLFTANAGRTEILSVLYTEACLWPEMFWDALASATSPAEKPSESLRRDSLRFLRKYGPSHGSSPLFAYHALCEHLSRSGGWSDTIETLSSEVTEYKRAPTKAEINWSRFTHDGIEVAKDYFERVRRSTLGERLDTNHILQHSDWTQLLECCDALEKVVHERPWSLPKFRKAKEELDREREELYTKLDRLASRPSEIIGRIKKFAPVSAVFVAEQMNIEIDDECPSIAMIGSDLCDCVGELLTNAAKYGGSSPITIRFRPLPGVLASVALEYIQDNPWRQPSAMEAGLNRIRALLKHYDAQLLIDESAVGKRPLFTLRFYSWPMLPSKEGKPNNQR